MTLHDGIWHISEKKGHLGLSLTNTTMKNSFSWSHPEIPWVCHLSPLWLPIYETTVPIRIRVCELHPWHSFLGDNTSTIKHDKAQKTSGIVEHHRIYATWNLGCAWCGKNLKFLDIINYSVIQILEKVKMKWKTLKGDKCQNMKDCRVCGWYSHSSSNFLCSMSKHFK